MRRLPAIAMMLLAMGTQAGAQKHSTTGIPADVGRAIEFLYNSPDASRHHGSVVIPRDSLVRGNVAVRGGPVTIAGHITGSLVVINSDLIFERGAEIDGQVYVVGGKVEGRELATIGSDYRVYAETLRYKLTDSEIVVEDIDDRSPYPMQSGDKNFWRRNDHSDFTTLNFITVNGGNAYNRIEGLPVLIGPRFKARREWGTFSLQARGIVRTAEPMQWGRGTLGHDARADIRFGNGFGLGVGVAAFDRVDPIEDWQIGDHEAALIAVGIHRDYRDYFGRHGARASASAFINEDASFSVGYGSERWESRSERDPWSLFRDREGWRPNPLVDEGHTRLLTSELRIDTRNQRYSPGNGWFIQADWERGAFDPEVGPTLAAEGIAVLAQSPRTYTRGLIDVRRYNRLAPGAQLNLRFVTGGWLSGDELPLQRRLSVGGPTTLPGFDFRTNDGVGIDRLQCSEGIIGRGELPALCDRMMLMQIEYRGDLSLHWNGSHRNWFPGDFNLPTWSIFADAGRGWRARDDGLTTYPIESMPSFRTFNTDIGVGLDFGSASIGIAKSMSDRKEPMNLVVRLARRF